MHSGSKLPSRLRYYLSSIPTLLFGVRNPWTLLALFWRRRPGSLMHLQDGLVFRVRTAMDAWVIKEACLDHDYEPPGFGIQPNWVIVDLGAGLGEFAIRAAKQAPRGIVYAYEPFPESFNLLEENIRLNGVTNVIPCRDAVGATVEPMRLNLDTGVPVLYTTVAQSRPGTGHEISVQGTSLEQVLRDRAISRCDLLKIDCEGAEFDILLHAGPDTLARIRRIGLEYHDGVTRFCHADLVQFLERAGFSVARRPNPVHRHTGLLYAWRAPLGDPEQRNRMAR